LAEEVLSSIKIRQDLPPLRIRVLY